jgi:hypothetical protein
MRMEDSFGLSHANAGKAHANQEKRKLGFGCALTTSLRGGAINGGGPAP